MRVEGGGGDLLIVFRIAILGSLCVLIIGTGIVFFFQQTTTLCMHTALLCDYTLSSISKLPSGEYIHGNLTCAHLDAGC